MKILIALLIILVAFIGWACLKVASDSDDEMERWANALKTEKEMQEKAQNSYEEYRRRFANDYGLTLEEATEYQAVKNYKNYLETEYKKYNVQICEKVGES